MYMSRRTVVMIALFMLLLSSIVVAECDEERIRTSIVNELKTSEQNIKQNTDDSFKAYEDFNSKQLFDFIHNIDQTMQDGVIFGLIAWTGIVLFVLSGWSYVKMRKERSILSQVMQNIGDMRTDLNRYMSYNSYQDVSKPNPQSHDDNQVKEPKENRKADKRPASSPRPVPLEETQRPEYSQYPPYPQQQQQQQQQQYPQYQQQQYPQYQQQQQIYGYPQYHEQPVHPEPKQRKKSLKEKMMEKRQKRLQDELVKVQEKMQDADSGQLSGRDRSVPIYSNQANNPQPDSRFFQEGRDPYSQ